MSSVDVYTIPASSFSKEEKIAMLDAEFDTGNVQWGDYGCVLEMIEPSLIDSGDIAVPQPRAAAPRAAAPMSENVAIENGEVPQDILDKLEMYERDALEGWKIPNITLRKGIWENFPVTLVPIDDGDGTDRYAIMWHRKNLAAWRNERSQSYDEYQEYEGFAEVRLFYALVAYEHKYTVEGARSDDQICVIAMTHAPVDQTAAPAPATESVVAAAVAEVVAPAPAVVAPVPAVDDGEGEFVPVATRRAPRSTVPVLNRLNDIKEHFPVVWRDVPSRNPNTAVYAIELFGKKIRELSTAAGRDLTEEIGTSLRAALKASNSWRVLRSEGREFCRIEMA
jgi:hypothetical protein